MSNAKLAYAYGSLMAKTASSAGTLAGGTIGAMAAGEGNREAGATLGGSLGFAANLIGIGYHSEPAARRLAGDKAVEEAIERGNKLFARKAGMDNVIGRYLGRTFEKGRITLPEYIAEVDRIRKRWGPLGLLLPKSMGGLRGLARKGTLGVGAGLAAAALVRAGYGDTLSFLAEEED